MVIQTFLGRSKDFFAHVYRKSTMKYGGASKHFPDLKFKPLISPKDSIITEFPTNTFLQTKKHSKSIYSKKNAEI